MIAAIRRTLLWSCLTAVLLSACSASVRTGGNAGESESLVPIRICTSAVSPLHLPAWYAYENGLFEQYGLDAEIIGLRNGSTAATAMIAGEVDACQIAASNIVNAALSEEDLVLLAGQINKHVYSLMVDPAIGDAADLKGKKVAVTRPGTATDTSLGVALEHLGLERDKDVVVIAAGSHSDIMAALTSGSVDGAVQGVPLSIQSQELGFRELLDMSTLPAPYQHMGLATNRRFISERREDAVNLMRAITNSTAQLRRDPEGAKAVLAKYLEMDPETEADLIQQTYEIVVLNYLEPIPYPTMEGIQALIDLAGKTNPHAAELAPEDVVDTSILQELKDSGFLSELYE